MEWVPNGGFPSWHGLRWGGRDSDGWLLVCVGRWLPLCFKEPLVFRRIHRYLCYAFFFYLLNVHINEYVLFIGVFGFRNIKLQK